MKLFLAAFIAIVIAASALSSCKKCYNCVNQLTGTSEYCAKDYSKSELNAIDTLCVHQGGSWENNNWW